MELLKSLSPQEMRERIEKENGLELEAIGGYSLDPGELHANIENFIGVSRIPLGIAGPVHVDGEYAKGDFLVPVAGIKQEVAARISRGLEVVDNRKIKTTISSDFMTRGPVLKTPTARHAREIADWVEANLPEIKKQAETTTRHGKLLWIKPYIVGRNLYLRFAYDTSKAMGMNMVTIATDKALELIGKHQGIFDPDRALKENRETFTGINIDTGGIQLSKEELSLVTEYREGGRKGTRPRVFCT